MPITPTYPGVYIQEIPSGVRTITGVATSVTAFVGRTLRGPLEEPVTINSYADFERTFGGLWVESALSYAVQDYYLNGGSQAIIVRLAQAATTATATVGDLTMEAASPGAWGNALEVEMDDDVVIGDGEPMESFFNLTVSDITTGAVEKFGKVSIDPSHPRAVGKVLENQSKLLRVTPDSSLPDTAPGPTIPGEKPEFSGGSDGDELTLDNFTRPGLPDQKRGLYALEKVDLFNLLCIPPYLANGNVDLDLIGAAAAYCEERRAMLIIDPPSDWTDKDSAKTGIGDITSSKNAALYFPRLRKSNPLRDNQLEDFVPCGAVAGVFARTDSRRGIWKAPAGLETTLNGVPQLSVPLTDAENGELNPLGINCLRAMPAVGRIIWGARTRQGDDRLASEWKYISVRRLALYIEESLYRGTQWVVFEPNDEPLWSQIRLNVGSFMQGLFRQGAFQGRTPREAYFVKCDKETTTQDDINRGVVNIIVGFAPLRPAEFVIISLQQMAGQVQA